MAFKLPRLAKVLEIAETLRAEVQSKAEWALVKLTKKCNPLGFILFLCARQCVTYGACRLFMMKRSKQVCRKRVVESEWELKEHQKKLRMASINVIEAPTDASLGHQD